MMCLGKSYFLEKAEIVPMNKTVTSVTDALISNLEWLPSLLQKKKKKG